MQTQLPSRDRITAESDMEDRETTGHPETLTVSAIQPDKGRRIIAEPLIYKYPVGRCRKIRSMMTITEILMPKHQALKEDITRQKDQGDGHRQGQTVRTVRGNSGSHF